MPLPLDRSAIFPFVLDAFQNKAMDALEQNKSVLVCAPTGSGKTVVAEFAVHLALEKNNKIFYTTPLKALSNQKYFHFCERFGSDKVGLLTGDTQINREAEIMVLTTEIYRNMLYKSEAERELLARSGFLVLDECHYMKDPDRGTVWEESIIYSPKQTQIIALSATIGNPQKIQDWVNEVHGPTELILSDFRPVPLRFFFFGREEMKPLNTPEGKINKSLLSQSKGKAPTKKASGGADHFPSVVKVISELKHKKMLPVIYFLFSRKGCDLALHKLASHDLGLLEENQKRQLQSELDEAVKQLPWLKEHPHFRALKKGIAAHHAGLLPALKGLIERLFQKNLIKVVFATETLAAGINMPARSVVISQISKRVDSGHRLLTASEFLQMGGRAGRRGLDEVGYVIVLETKFEGAWEVCHLASSPVDNLNSSFTPSYTMVLNLSARFGWDQCKELVLKSFSRYELQSEIKSLKNIEKQLQTNLDKNKSDKKKDFKTLKRLDKIQRELTYSAEIPWPDFERAAAVMKKFDYLDKNLKPTPKGVWAADLRCDNILLLAEIIANKILDDLGPLELCGVICALSSYEIRWENQHIGTSWAITDKIEKAVRESYELIKTIAKVQQDNDLNVRIPFNPLLIELGFDWGCAYEWPDLIEKYKADEGDIVKVLKQAADILKQIQVCPGSSFDMANKASKAFDLIYRSPIKDELNLDD
ncbi:MAG: DEAD/DEAH box helicase [Candidatus Caenarcaniphilales bacterium]|nr:DEAD/DEAH box helicase [Candidatus Caenarcaniphilales bacterium]